MCSNPMCKDHPAKAVSEPDRYNYQFATSENKQMALKNIMRTDLLYSDLRNSGYSEDLARTIVNAAYVGVFCIDSFGFPVPEVKRLVP